MCVARSSYSTALQQCLVLMSAWCMVPHFTCSTPSTTNHQTKWVAQAHLTFASAPLPPYATTHTHMCVCACMSLTRRGQTNCSGSSNYRNHTLTSLSHHYNASMQDLTTHKTYARSLAQKCEVWHACTHTHTHTQLTRRDRMSCSGSSKPPRRTA